MHAFVRGFLRSEDAATAVEYGLIAALISMVVFAAVTSVFNGVGNSFNLVSSKLQNVATPSS